jgi:hypothetical protein
MMKWVGKLEKIGKRIRGHSIYTRIVRLSHVDTPKHTHITRKGMSKQSPLDNLAQRLFLEENSAIS